MKLPVLILAMAGMVPVCFTGQASAAPPTLDELVAQPATAFYNYRGMKDLLAYVDSVKPEQIPAIMAQFDSMPQHPGNIQVQMMLADVWAENDPKAFVEWCAQKGGGASTGYVKRWASDVGYSALAAHDPNTAIAEAQKLPNAARRRALSAIGKRLAETDPVAALNLTQKIEDNAAVYDIFFTWAKHDPDAATKTLLQFTVTTTKLTAVNGMVGGFVSKDPHLAVAWMEQLPEGSLRDNARQVLATAWTESDPPAALEWLKTLPSSSMKNSI